MTEQTQKANQQEHLREIVREVQRLAGVHQHVSRGRTSVPLVIGVTSPRSGDGKTTVAMAVANSLANDFEGGAALVDADFETHSIGEQYGLARGAGLFEVLSGEASPSDVIHTVPDRALRVIPAGMALDRSARVLTSGSGSQRMRELGAEAQFVVVDLPATFNTASTPLLARLCDAVVVVARSGKTTQRDLGLTLDRLTDANVVGVVLNRWSSRIPAVVERLLGLAR